ncbi:hypothetical protein [Salegentibacter sp. Hel_I_6]|uniref:hypothetical protein n=1 Tax=Salegentibacter sp. Hel_I_6 TaxID=1250278 RepID=UPI0005693DE1|nr:hypothetical protein [Salegentibacter sp. Hel_I_6]
MKIYILIVLFFIFSPGIQAQEKIEIIKYSAETAPGDALSFDGKSVEFKEVILDSRCPSNVTCVRAGEAKVLVALYEKEKLLGEEVINVGANSSSFQTFLGDFFKEDYAVNLFSLLPYPETSRKISASEYRLQLEISQHKEEG